MPITQERMLSLIAAADDLQQAVESAALFVKSALDTALRTGDYQRQLEGLASDISLHLLLLNPASTIATIAVERRHFAINKSRNESARRWHAKKRGDLGITPLKARDTSLQPIELSSALRAPRPSTSSPPSPTPASRSSKRDATGAPLRDLSYDETDPENAFNESGDGFKIILTPEEKTILDSVNIESPSVTSSKRRQAEIEGANIAMSEHQSRVIAGASAEDDLISCSCGFRGDLDDWREHLEAAEAEASDGEKIEKQQE